MSVIKAHRCIGLVIICFILSIFSGCDSPSLIFLITKPLSISKRSPSFEIYEPKELYGEFKVNSYGTKTAQIKKNFLSPNSSLIISHLSQNNEGRHKIHKELFFKFHKVYQFFSKDQQYPRTIIEAKIGPYYSLFELAWTNKGFDLFKTEFDPKALVENRIEFQHLLDQDIGQQKPISDIILINSTSTEALTLLNLIQRESRAPILSLEFISDAQRTYYKNLLREKDVFAYMAVHLAKEQSCEAAFNKAAKIIAEEHSLPKKEG